MSTADSPQASRRRFLQAAALLGLSPVAWAGSRPPSRLVVMNWELTESVLALGITPVGVPLPYWYRNTIVEPPLPQTVADVGLLYQPSFEALQALKPDLLILTPGHAPALPLLQRLAPTLTLGRYMRSPQPYPALQAELRTLAAALGRQAQAEALIAHTAHLLQQCRTQLAAFAPRQTLVADLADDRHLRIYGNGSLFDAVLQRLGVSNAIHAGTTTWPTNDGGFAMVPLQRLAELPDAALLLVGPVTPAMQAALARNAIWQALPQSRRMALLPVIAPTGGLISMQRFASAVTKALPDLWSNRRG